MMPSEDFAELHGLLDALCEETITADQMRRLEEILLRRPEAEAYYVQYMSLYADLARQFAAAAPAQGLTLAGPGSAGTVPTVPAARPSRRRAWAVVAGTIAAAGIAAALFLALSPKTPMRLKIERPALGAEALDNTVAVLLQTHEAEWEEGDLRPGTALPPGRLRLKSGVAQIEFYCGATVILQGPADFKVISRTEAYCARGSLRATVPPQAQGFTVGSPKLDLVDRGTEFGLRVGADERTEVHVFQGQVDLYDGPRTAAPLKELTTGKGVRVDGPGELRPIPTDPEGFQTAEGLAELSGAETRRRQEKWRDDCDAVRRTDGLVVYYTFQPRQAWSRTLPDQAPGRKPAQDGAIIGAAWAAGRWPGKGALEFKRVSDRVRFHVPGEFESLTLAAWVRVDNLPNLNNSLMMADGWDDGAPHWQIGDDGTLILGVQGPKKSRGGHYHAPGAITPDLFGRWLHLAVVYDGAAGKVTHYVDGRAVAEVKTEFDIPLRIGDAELGNWNMATHRNITPIRFLSGSMDEFLMLSRPLSADEIGQLYAQGRPPG
jgi:hypothetical protein